MRADEYRDGESFEEIVREIARDLGESVERAIEQLDLDELAGTIGVDSGRARDWVGTAGGWLRSRVERLGEEVVEQTHHRPAPAGEGAAGPDPLRSAAPHPLDLPSEEQGLALAALDSGRWEVEAASNRLTAREEGPAPDDALGVVRELRVRDWITADGRLTLAGRSALRRWLEPSRQVR